MDVFTHFSIVRRERRGIRPEEIKNLDRIDRSSCRAVVEQKYSLEALGNRVINWFEEIFARSQK
ncbi:hypothetical protein [Microcystis aeruginosa]|uniref:hypothetical protein n=1 Tax=Microcystis aeruginosa TaxID=1126 RepID=UPI0035574740